MSHERNEESGCWTGWGPTRFLGRHKEAKFPVGSSQIEPENSDEGETYRLKGKHARQEKYIELPKKRVTESNEREQDLMGKLDRFQAVGNGKNAGGEKLLEEMEAEITQLKRRLKRKTLKLFKVEKDAKERNDRKETSIKRLETKVNELRRLNEDADREVSRKAWTIRKLEEKVAELNQQVKVQSRRSAWRGGGSDTTAVELSQRLQVKVSEMEEAARHKEEEVRVLEAKVAELSRCLQEAGRWKEEIGTMGEAAPRKEKETGRLEPKTVEKKLNLDEVYGLPEDSGRKERHLEEVVERLKKDVLQKEREGRMLKAKVAGLSQRVREASIKQPDYAVTNLNRLLPEEIGTTGEAAPRKEKETKGLDPKIAYIRERSPGETEDSGRKERHMKDLENKRLETKVAGLELQLQEKTIKLTTKLSTMEDDIRRREQENRDLSATTQKQRDEINQLKALVKAAGKQPNNPPSQALVRKADSISAVEVADLVRMLNAQIEAVSTLIADTFSYREPSGSRERSAALNDLRDYLGPWLFNDLSRRSNEPEMESDPLIIQIALQTVLVHACSRIINHWNPPFWDDGSIFFRVYSNMGGVGHIIAGTWSAVAHTMSQNKVRETNVKHLSETVVKAIAAVGGSPPSGKSLPPEYKEKIEDIAKRALDLHQLVTKDVTSMDLVTYTVPSDTKFDPSQMDDTEGSAESVPQDRVICTLEMGLQYRKRPELGVQGGEQLGVTLKPKVVLSAALEA